MSFLIGLAERGFLPDSVIRFGIRRLARRRLLSMERFDLQSYCEFLRTSPLALATDKANEQHYEVPQGFFAAVLGKNLKYSSCFFDTTTKSLSEAEDRMLALTAERAELRDGQDVLELGCGWGSLTLWMAAHFPGSRITAVSNSVSQREYIESEAKKRGLANVHVITCDMNSFDIAERFDRIVSVEMFEHMRNYELLFARMAEWLKAGGKLFVHVFAHRSCAYTFETEGASNWMGRYFFTGGQMPSHDLLPVAQKSLELEQQWVVDGTHYQKTAEAWAANLENRKSSVLAVLRSTYGNSDAKLWFYRWKIFFLACAELFGFGGGQEWWVSHYRFVKTR